MINATPRPLYPRERDRLPFLQENDWNPGPVWTVARHHALTGIRFPNVQPKRVAIPGPYKICNGIEMALGGGVLSSSNSVLSRQLLLHHCSQIFCYPRLVKLAHFRMQHGRAASPSNRLCVCVCLCTYSYVCMCIYIHMIHD